MSLECEEIMTDFEKGMRNAIAIVVPNVRLTACWFHFSAACKKKAMRFFGAMVQLIRSNEEAASIYYRLLCLPLLPADRIIAAFESLKIWASKFPAFNGFIAYFERQWLERVC